LEDVDPQTQRQHPAPIPIGRIRRQIRGDYTDFRSYRPGSDPYEFNPILVEFRRVTKVACDYTKRPEVRAASLVAANLQVRAASA